MTSLAFYSHSHAEREVGGSFAPDDATQRLRKFITLAFSNPLPLSPVFLLDKCEVKAVHGKQAVKVL
mgnify:CR=1 FL=1